uniref:Ovule protein n=1 Tax=Bursaphelenchus xylophilus TaxID=6326 RepID=A0A1I7S337_BURXY
MEWTIINNGIGDVNIGLPNTTDVEERGSPSFLNIISSCHPLQEQQFAPKSFKEDCNYGIIRAMFVHTS